MRLLLCCLLVLLTLPTSQPHAQDNAGLTIGFVSMGYSESEWYVAVHENFKEEAGRRGIHLLFAEASARQGYVNAFRYYVEQNVDAILLVPFASPDWDELLREAQDAGVPVIIIDRMIPVDESLYLTFVSGDFVDQGRLAAAWLAQATSGVCQIVELEGTAGSGAAMQRQAGFDDVLALFPQMEIIAAQNGDFMRPGGEAAMSQILATIDPADICAVWAQNDAMALGAIDVLKNAGLDPGDDILIVSIDAEPDMLRALAEGDANATVEFSPLLAGPTFDALDQYLAGEAVPRWIPIRGGIFTQDTVAERPAE